MDDPNVARREPRDPSKLVYVPEDKAERAARQGRMSSPLRRGAHESWWSADQGFFNAVAKVGIVHYEANARLSLHTVFSTRRDVWFVVEKFLM